MPKREKRTLVDFGSKLTQLRKEAGLTQLELADEIGVSRRMIAYYEGESQHPPASLLPDLAQVLGVTTDELLGVAPLQRKSPSPSNRLLRRLQQIEKLKARERRQLLRIVDTFLENERLKKQVGSR